MFTLPNLPYPYEALEPFIDKETMTIHHTKHHQAYVDKLNAALEKYPDLQKKTIEELLKDLNSIPEEIRTAVRNNGGGHYNHSLFWRIMAPAATTKTSGTVAPLNTTSPKFMETLNSTYGGFDSFKTAFKNAALNRFGSGWVWIIKHADKIEIVDTPNQDTPLMEGKLPILGLDVWEHAYYLKYKNLRADYVDAWWNVVNWPEVEKIYTNIA